MDIKGVQDVGTFRKSVCHKINEHTQRITYSLNIEKSIYNYHIGLHCSLIIYFCLSPIKSLVHI